MAQINSAELEKKITKDRAFCILPWVQFYITGEGKIQPCCHATAKRPLGWYEGQSTEKIMNSESFRQLRLDFLEGKPRETLCDSCYFIESNGGRSQRQDSNLRFKKDIASLLSDTNENGALKNPKLIMWDVRFSNLCNFRCVICDSTYSSSWESKLGQKTNPILFFEEEKFAQFAENIKYVEHIHFAGGEPLLIENHYRLLNLLIQNNRTNVSITYNTNMSRLSLANWDVLDLWKKFSNICVLASLDEVGARAEYIRKGTSWTKIKENISSIKFHCPEVSIFANITISNMNILRIPEILSSFWEDGIVNPVTNFICNNIVYEPEALSALTIPEKVRLEELERLKTFRKKSENSFGVSLSQLDFVENLLQAPYLPPKQSVINFFENMDGLLGGSFPSSLPELFRAIKN
jgi:organic radical activating enzyme